MNDPYIYCRVRLSFGDGMAYIKYLILLLAFFANVAIAGYAQLKPPPGWSSGMSAAIPAQVGVFKFGAAANSGTFKGNTVLTNAALNVAGTLVTVPVSMRVAVNAASLAANYSFRNPLLFAGIFAGSIALDYWKEDGIELIDGIWQKKDPDACTSGVCYGYLYRELTYPTRSTACNAIVAFHNTLTATNYSYSLKSCGTDSSFRAVATLSYKYMGMPWGEFVYTADRVVVPPSTVSYKPATVKDFEDRVLKSPMPDGMAESLPIDYPVELPIYNPNPLINPLPAPSPNSVPRPLFVPTGDPVPTSDPNVWNQPGVRTKGAPIPDSPWRVDLQPEDIPQNSPLPKTVAELNPSIPIIGTPTPTTQIGLCDQYPGILACAPASLYEPTKEDVEDYCVKNPDILACQKTDEPEVPDLETKDKQISITPDSGWGSGGGSCPAPRHFSKGEFSFQIYCDFASGLKPVIIAVAWLVAAGILIGFKFGDS